MTYKSTPIKYNIGDRMKKGTFESFIRHFPNQWLRSAGEILGDQYKTLDRLSFYAVAHALIEVGDFKTGENFRLSQLAIADISGASPKTVRRVLSLLEKTGAIRVVAESKRPGGGTPVKNYTLVYSEHVHQVVTIRDRNLDRDLWKRSDRSALGSTTPVQWVAQPHPVGSTTPPSGEHNPTIGMSMNVDTNESVTSVPSSASTVAQPTASDDAGEQENREKKMPTVEELTAGMEPVFTDDFKVPLVERSGSRKIEFLEPRLHDDIKLNDILRGF
ncbi:helix-turn-helix domain-containing protein [Microbacterium foliorum]|uniref:HTH crp-type domain-containing protein n=1 Tax=Microbacterium foliorum TaxID=104336 RepID=A0A0F0KRM7_9MICO|nr:helix-turn-helix domain-containing protein [Microbacterium foliorum]KJL23139.1 hypothetical protein RN50_01077 [Microbacterium foliorum]